MASKQHGVVTRAQCVAAGLSSAAISRRRQRGHLIPVLSGVFRIPGAPQTWRQSLIGAVYWAGEGAAASHRAAAALHRCPGIRNLSVEVSGEKEKRRIKDVAYHRVSRLDEQDIHEVDGIRTTSAARTVVDLAGVIEAALLGKIIDDLLRRRLMDLESLADTVVRAGGSTKKGRGTLLKALNVRSGRGGPSHSALERRLYKIIVDAGLPVPIRQFRIRARDRTMYPDCAYPQFKIAVEADSYEWHRWQSARQNDYSKDRILRSLGWKVLRFSWEDIYFHPDYVVGEIRQALEDRGALAV
jgi:very-short-patch-repair endonuclease